ncbi:uncharacterized protein LOC119078468 [Bradysia coprophila]|uniref:uncharacterized protein LOC119078468 n=1 Tax=Bradysia coprophila TaxID=38358 RepID=UPI00187DD1E6|nr:uncharacterized protein LOC119078468 [Bradysia coprophila]
MAIEINVLLVIGLLALIRNVTVNGQDPIERFIVTIGHVNNRELSEKCVGTLISEQHILCTATCVSVRPPTQIAIIIPPVSETTTRIVIHPFYENNHYSNNAALVMTTTFRSNPHLGFVPRQLGGYLSTTNSCSLFGWGGRVIDARRDEVFIESPVDCNVNYPQSYCSNFDSVAHLTCSALEASPVTCGNDMIVSGFVSTDGCSPHGDDSARLNYHSVSDFQDWIEGVIGSQLPERREVNFIVIIMDRNTLAIPQCFGTIISSNRVLTTATCASIDSMDNLVVQSRYIDVAWPAKQNFSVTQVYVHPSFRQDNPFENNVAIISVNGSFSDIIIPRTLGSLDQNSSCQLFGWGPTDSVIRGDAITVSTPQECNGAHPHAFCSTHPTIFHHLCYAMTGTPVTCGGNEGVIAGFLINNATCSNNNSRVSLSYHSVSDFYDWIADLDPVNTDPPTDGTPTNPPTDGAAATKMLTAFVLIVSLISCAMMNRSFSF